ncbi:hypothetical protein JL107_08555 [Nakamurella flavida]|uniref:Fibronectin type-III domain-containing protein n=1 Tax=Nakamurella flavida TaxID=363630 RepID=A0A939C559_9ACTN|nr:hypothetical protein [Nakamurella flavida]MBM9476489.1 hypothetical protein [Nakamurella flavida]MDP9779075.1 hypothetical protein [Nakamurella flavida]
MTSTKDAAEQLALRMYALRDEYGLKLVDAVIRQAAKDAGGTLESLDRRFRMAGLPQPRNILRQLVELRTTAEKALPPPSPGFVVDGPTPDAPVSPPVPAAPAWAGPPAWYDRMTRDEPTPPPNGPPVAAPPSPAGPPSWYTPPELDVPPAAVNPPAARSSPAAQVPPAAQTDPYPGIPSGSAGASRLPVTEADLVDPLRLSARCDVFGAVDERLQIRTDNGRVILRWPAAADLGSDPVYLVVAADAVVPESPDDGHRVVASLLNQVIVPGGSGPAFAVFAYPVSHAGELGSATGVRQAIGRVVPEVGDLHLEAQEHGVLLSWVRPARAERVRVMRSLPDEPLPSRPDPSLQVSFSGDAFRDADVEPGSTYEYRVYTESQAMGGSGMWESSTGVTRQVTVPGRPSAVDDLQAHVDVRSRRAGVSASWTAPRRGRPRVYLRAGEPPDDVVAGAVLSAEQFAMQETLLGLQVREPVITREGRQTMDWIALDDQDAEGRTSRWTVSVVTEFAGRTVIGAQRVVVHVGDVTEAAVEERTDWQLLRVTWPAGATFLGIWTLPPGTPTTGGPHRRVTRDEFDTAGGIALQLEPHAQDLVVQGATRYGSTWVTGGVERVTYPGRWVVRYQLVAGGRFGGSRLLQVAVERPDWPEIGLELVAGTQGFPLTVPGPGVDALFHGRMPTGSLVPGQYVPASAEIRVPKGAAVRLRVSGPSGLEPLVVDPLDAVNPPPPPGPVPVLRCPRCLRGTDLAVQAFRCQGSCREEPDLPQTALLDPGMPPRPETMRRGKPVFTVSRAVDTDRPLPSFAAPVGTAVCPRPNCGRPSHEHVCPHCHTTLPPNWWAQEVLGVVVVGARSSGKTTYLSLLIRHLEQNLLPSVHGNLHPVDAASEAKLDVMRRGLMAGQLAEGTQGAEQNLPLLAPMLAGIGTGPHGRGRNLALFDVAGEDMSTAEGVRLYSPALSAADMVLILIDPLQLDGVREWLDGTVPLPPRGAPPARVVHNVVQQIRRQAGVPTGPLPVRAAVAFAKFDGLQAAASIPQSSIGDLIGPGNALWRDPYVGRSELYLEPDGRRVHDEVRALLVRMGESGLVALVEDSFRQVQYFAVSALGHGPRGRQVSAAGASPQRVGDPLRWLLWNAGWDGRR